MAFNNKPHPRGPLATQKYNSYARRYQRSAAVSLATIKYVDHLSWDDRHGKTGEFCAEKGTPGINTTKIPAQQVKIIWDVNNNYVVKNIDNYNYFIRPKPSFNVLAYSTNNFRWVLSEGIWSYETPIVGCWGSPYAFFGYNESGMRIADFCVAINTIQIIPVNNYQIVINDDNQEYIYNLIDPNSVSVLPGSSTCTYIITDTVKTEEHSIAVIDPNEQFQLKGYEWLHKKYLIKSSGNPCNPSGFSCTCPDFTQQEREGQHWLDPSLQQGDGVTRNWAGSSAGPFNPCKHIMAAKRLLEIPQSYGGYP